MLIGDRRCLMLPMRTILVPTDFSCSSANAFTIAASLAREGGARVILLHVLGEPTFADVAGLVPYDPATYRDEMREKLEHQASYCPGLQLEKRLTHGKPIPEIIRIATETRCDLIVMGTHGTSGLRRLLMGSVAEGVARRATCPVLSVRTSVPQDALVPELAAAAAE
jgi:nucleotide-binding universal stress UspA family protein